MNYIANTQFKHRRVKIPYCHQNGNCCISSSMKNRLDSLNSGHLIWFLKKDQIEYIRKQYGYSVEPHIYKIKVFRSVSPYRIQNTASIIKELSRCMSQKKSQLIIRLKKQDIDILDSYGIDYVPYKYIIHK